MSTFFADYPVTGGITSLNGLTGALTIVGAGGITVMASGSTITLTGSGGTVTSIGLADSTGLFNITGSPVMTSGTLTLASFQSQAQDTFFAAPQGSSGAPTFRLISIGDLSFAGQANGVATLDSSGKVPASELPSTVLEYQGLWDPSTNTPLLTDLTGTNGYVYQVSTAFPGPIIGLNSSTMVNFQVGNLVIYSSAAGEWQQADALTGVTSVNGAVGAVTVNAINQLTGDITAGPASGSQSQVASLVATSNSTLTTLSSLSLPFTQTTGTVPINRGGTGQVTASAAFNALSPVTSTGDLIIGNGTNSATRLAIGSSTQVLTVSGGTAVWAPAPATGVTSVALADGSTTPIFAITGSPVTSSGTLTETLVTQSANAIFAGPTTGVAAQPAFRGLVSADIPNNAANTTGTASNITASSNSTLTTLSSLSLPYSQVTGAPAAITALTGDGTATGPGSTALTLASVNSNIGSFTNANITVNAKGLITAASNGSGGSGTVTSIAFSSPLTGGTITTSGTVGLGSVAGNTTVLKAPTITTLTSNGTQTGLVFTVTSANATIGATYTNNSNTYTVLQTIAAGTTLFVSGTGSTSGTTLTKASGTGDATITLSSATSFEVLATYTTPTSPAPLYLEIEMIGGGGGGGGAGSGGTTAGGNGGTTYLGTNLLIATGGSGGGANAGAGSSGGVGGTATVNSPALGQGFTGGQGSYGSGSNGGTLAVAGGNGASSPFGGGGAAPVTGAGKSPGANTGAGGGGTNDATDSSAGGGAGGYVNSIITSPAATYFYSIGAAGTAGNGVTGNNGGAGAAGIIYIKEKYQ